MTAGELAIMVREHAATSPVVDCRELAARAARARRQADALRVSAAWQEHDAATMRVRGYGRRAAGLERQAAVSRADAEALESSAVQALELSAGVL